MKFKDYLYHLVNLSTPPPQKKIQITYIHSKFKMIHIPQDQHLYTWDRMLSFW